MTQVEKQSSTLTVNNENENETIKRHEYVLNEVRAMEKKMEYIDRESGINIDDSRGAEDKQNVYLIADTASYEHFRINCNVLLENKFGDKIAEVNDNKKKSLKVDTKNSGEAYIEEKRKYMYEGTPVHMTLYHTTCSIFLQASKNVQVNGMTAALSMAKDLELVSKDMIKSDEVKKLIDGMKKKIAKWYDTKKKTDKGKSGPKDQGNASKCIKCKDTCKTNFQKCITCENFQHVQCSNIGKNAVIRQLYNEGKKPIACVECVAKPANIQKFMDIAITFITN